MIVFSDNVGAEKCTAGGAAKAHDHNRIVHGIWAHAFHSRFNLWLERVPTENNIADAPSRFDYRLLNELGARWCRPALANLYLSDADDLVSSLGSQAGPARDHGAIRDTATSW